MWLTNPSFSTLVDNSWNSSAFIPSSSFSLSRFQHCLKLLTTNIINWNKNHFSILFQKKNRVLARLKGIQIAISRKPSTYLYSLEHQLIQDYNHILCKKFLFQQLKSRVTRLNYGDANTKFFHLKTLQNHSQSCITTLKDSTRLCVSGDKLTTHITVVFTKLFMSTSPHMVSHFPLVRYYHQNNPFLKQHQRLSSTPLPKGINQNVFSLPPLKSPGLDGYHAIFFQKIGTFLDLALFMPFKKFLRLRLSLKIGVP